MRRLAAELARLTLPTLGRPARQARLLRRRGARHDGRRRCRCRARRRGRHERWRPVAAAERTRGWRNSTVGAKVTRPLASALATASSHDSSPADSAARRSAGSPSRSAAARSSTIRRIGVQHPDSAREETGGGRRSATGRGAAPRASCSTVNAAGSSTRARVARVTATMRVATVGSTGARADPPAVRGLGVAESAKVEPAEVFEANRGVWCVARATTIKALGRGGG